MGRSQAPPDSLSHDRHRRSRKHFICFGQFLRKGLFFDRHDPLKYLKSIMGFSLETNCEIRHRTGPHVFIGNVDFSTILNPVFYRQFVFDLFVNRLGGTLSRFVEPSSTKQIFVFHELSVFWRLHLRREDSGRTFHGNQVGREYEYDLPPLLFQLADRNGYSLIGSKIAGMTEILAPYFASSAR